MNRKELANYDQVTYVGPEHLLDNVKPGDVGFIIELRGSDYFEVEFSRADGTTYATHVIAGSMLVSCEG